MKKIGIVGGIAWRSTVEYYAALCRRAEEWHFARKLPGVPSMPETDDAAERIQKVAKLSFDRFRHQPAVCLACTELPLAFPELKALGIFEYRGVLYVNTSVLHANAALEFAIEQQ